LLQEVAVVKDPQACLFSSWEESSPGCLTAIFRMFFRFLF
jgi:hypothetical protein